jgi:molybdenum cofactor cytidylyltransferase
MAERVNTGAAPSAVVLAAGAGSRFGGGKLLAELDGIPLIAHVLQVARSAPVGEIVVVVPPAAALLVEVVAAHGAKSTVNPDPSRGIASSLRVGLAAVAPGAPSALILLGDQPRVAGTVIQALLSAVVPAGKSIVAPRYSGRAGPNPLLLLRSAWRLAEGLRGDRGMQQVMRARPELVFRVRVEGENPDVDTPADLARLQLADPPSVD